MGEPQADVFQCTFDFPTPTSSRLMGGCLSFPSFTYSRAPCLKRYRPPFFAAGVVFLMSRRGGSTSAGPPKVPTPGVYYSDVNVFLAHFAEAVPLAPAFRDEVLIALTAYPEGQVSLMDTTLARTASSAGSTDFSQATTATATSTASGMGGRAPTSPTATSLVGGAIHVNVKLRIDTPTGAIVTIIVPLALSFPNGHADAPPIAFRSVGVPGVVLRSLEQQLTEETLEMRASMGCFSLMVLLSRAVELVSQLPVERLSEFSGCCLQCNQKLVKNGKSKSAQPLTVTFDTSLQDDESSNRVITQAACLICKSDLVMYSDALVPNMEETCSMCLVEDNPLIKLECGCLSCVACFQAFADISTGERRVQFSKRHGRYGVSCPNHPGALIVDPTLMKLMNPRSFGRFNLFALLAFAQSFGMFVCPVPGCAGLPTFSEISGGLLKCAFCRQYSCVKCNREAVRCECDELAPDQTSRYLEQRAFSPPVQSRFAYERKPCPEPPVIVDSGRRWYGPGMAAAINPPAQGSDATDDMDGVTLSTLSPWQIAWRRYVKRDPHAATRFKVTEKVLAFFGLQKHVVELPLFDPEWHRALDDVVFPYPSGNAYCVWTGVPLPRNQPLCHSGLVTGAVLFIVMHLPQDGRDRRDEIELWQFRRSIAAANKDGGGAAAADEANQKLGTSLWKPCPKCTKPVVHYFNHGCHHMGVHGSCCGHMWCYLCRADFPGGCKCPIFCQPNCTCPLCPDCKPFRPCVLCTGCPRCQVDELS